jgi:hypothetical protein
MAKSSTNSGVEAVQVELATTYRAGTVLRMVTWVEASLRPVKGMTLVRPNDERRWEVSEAYTGNVNRMEGISGHWKVIQ